MRGRHIAERPPRRVPAGVLAAVWVLVALFAVLTWLIQVDDDGTQDGADQRIFPVLLVVVLVVVSLGWFLGFRRLREAQRASTERRALDAGERRLLALVRHGTDVVAVIEPDSTTTFLSPAVAVLGWSPEELTGRPLLDVVSPSDRLMMTRLLTGSSGDAQSVQLRMRHRDGHELVMEGNLVNLCDDTAVRGWVLTIRDITERKRLQEDLTTQALHDLM